MSHTINNSENAWASVCLDRSVTYWFPRVDIDTRARPVVLFM